MSIALRSGRLLLRRVLLRHRPARLARLEAELFLQGAVVDLVDDAVDVVGQAVAQRGDRGVEVDQAGRALHLLVHRARRQADRVEGVEQAGLGRRHAPAVDLAEAVGEEAERPLDRVARVELAHHAGGGVARVDEGLLALRAALDELPLPLVEGLEVVAAHEDLAAHLEHLRLHALQPLGHGGDGAHRVGHVLAGLAVAARRRLHQLAALVAQVDRQAVELHLGRVGDRRDRLRPGRAPCGCAASNFSAPAAVVSVSVSIESIGTAWRTGCRPSSTAPITRWVGESGVTSSGCAASIACSSW